MVEIVGIFLPVEDISIASGDSGRNTKYDKKVYSVWYFTVCMHVALRTKIEGRKRNMIPFQLMYNTTLQNLLKTFKKHRNKISAENK